jgi:transposase
MNFFTFIDSANKRNTIAQRGMNKQKRIDLRQVGMAMLASREKQFPIFHKTYQGNLNDVKVFENVFGDLVKRLDSVYMNGSKKNVTIVFDKGINSKNNFEKIDSRKNIYYVGGLVSSHFKDLLEEANGNFKTETVDGKSVQVYRKKSIIWNIARTTVVTISEQLRQGQIAGIKQHLEKKYKLLNQYKCILEKSGRKKSTSKEDIELRLKNIIRGQFIEHIVKWDIVYLNSGQISFSYYLDEEAFDNVIKNMLGRKILVTNRHNWSNEEIILAYRQQYNVENVFRTIKNPFHMAVRPQYHWTDHNITVHFFTCIIGYLLASCAFSALKESEYKHGISKMLDDLRSIRIACILNKKTSQKHDPAKFQLEVLSKTQKILCNKLKINNKNLVVKLNISSYTS